MLETRSADPRSRRGLLQAGVLGAFALPELLCLRRLSAGPRPADACVLIWLDGGPSHLDTFDPKPEAPDEIRGEFRAIETSVSGVRFSEHLPLLARQMHRLTVIRSLTHELGNHDTGSHYLLTGRRPSPALAAPSLGSFVARSRQPARTNALPPYVSIPDSVAAGGPGFLPGAFAAFAVGGDPARPDFRVRDLEAGDGARRARRKDYVEALNRLSGAVPASPAVLDREAYLDQARALLASPGAETAFAVHREPAEARTAYGRGRLGTSCLLARRLVEAGVPFVTVVDPGWDTHQRIFKALPDAFFPGSGKLPALDRAVSTLLVDLGDRGLLDRTLVVVMGEFGRTPKLNAAGGRDHWPRAGFACLAGGGLRGGQVVGATDAHGEAPAEAPVRPEDLAFTLLSRLGVNPRERLVTPDGRPVDLLPEGRLIPAIG